MPRRILIPIWLTLAVAILSCVNTRIIRFETQVRPSKPLDYPIEILDSANLGKPFKVIGIVQANSGKLHDVADTLEHLKSEARTLGGDALIDLQQGSAPGGMVTPAGGGAYVYGNLREIWSAKVIVWTSPESPEQK